MFRRTGIIGMLALTTYLTCGFSEPTSCNQPAPSHTGAEVAAVAILSGVAIGTAVLIDIHHHHHTVKGCVFQGASGVEIRDAGYNKTFTLSGEMPRVKVGDMVRLKGSRVKLPKGSQVDQQFVVTSFSKDYGPCKDMPASAAPTTTTVEKPAM